jgi:hypothetical protein
VLPHYSHIDIHNAKKVSKIQHKEHDQIIHKLSNHIYDFKLNLNKLTHHQKWASGNPKIKQIIEEGRNQQMTINNKPSSQDDCMSPEEIHNLFAIESKNQQIRDQLS